MLTEPIEDVESASVETLLDRYGRALEEALEATGRNTLLEDGVPESAIQAIEAEAYGSVTVEDAARVLSSVESQPPVDVIEAEVQDTLLVGMANAVLDVDALAAELDTDLTPREIQQRVEGRAPMHLDTYAAIRRTIAQN